MPAFSPRHPARVCRLGAAAVVALAACSSSRTTAAPAAPPAPDPNLTTNSGVYTVAQAARGKDLYLLQCVSCHDPADYTGGGFWADLVGKNVARFFNYLRENMPQDNPGALADDDYIDAVAYILQLNKMPPGAKPLVADTAVLSKIRFVAPATPPHLTTTGR